MKAFFLSFLLCYSCSKKATLSRDDLGSRIGPVVMELSHLNEIKWNVGLKKDSTISQSFIFTVDMPNISQKDLSYLNDQKDIDSWIVRLIVSRQSDTQDLGSLYTLFKPKRLGQRNQTAGAATSISMKVYYAAAFASERFRTMKCPQFGHNKKISSMNIQGSNEDFTISIDQTMPYGERSQLVELTPSSFNGGNSLVGDYFVEIAPYNSTKRLIYSDFKRLPMSVKIAEEETIKIQNCTEK